MVAPLLLYDGDCGFCARQVRFILRHEREQTLRFAPLGGTTAAGVVERHPELRGVDSMVWVEGTGGSERVMVRSAAALRVAAYLGGLWRLALVGYIIPGGWRDAWYDLVARHRQQLSGVHCALPVHDRPARFLS